jgi:hypothetical protein
VIRDSTGLSYKEFLSFIRVEESERLLLGTDMKITQISDAVGFSAVRYYIKYFEKWYGMAPSVYREEYREAAKGTDVDQNIRDVESDEARQAVKRINNEIYREYAVTSDPGEEEITIKLARGTGADEARHYTAAEMFARIRRNMRPAALLHDLFVELGYATASSGDGFIASVKMAKASASRKKSKSQVERAAVFLFGSEENDKFEKLIKVEGLNGRYRITIMRLTAESVDASRRYSKRHKAENAASDIHDRIAAYPEVRRSETAAAGSLVFDIQLRAPGSELILFERVD